MLIGSFIVFSALASVISGACDLSCMQCSNDTCELCTNGKFLYGGSCLDKCPNNYYESGLKCNPCVSPCKRCTSDTACLSCDNSLNFLYKDSCLTTCPTTSVPTYNVDQSYCNPCSAACATCSGNISNCLSCADSAYSLYLGVCIAACPSGLFAETQANSTSKVCSKCFDNCEYCTTSSKCKLCAKGYYLSGDGNSCITDCPEGYLKDSIYRLCYLTQCPAGKFDVTAISNDSSKPTYAVQCASTCPSGYYVNSAKQMCKKCHSSCTECTGPNDTDCLVCHETCDNCAGSNFTQCLSCSTTRTITKLFNQPVGECVCNSGTVEELEKECSESGLSDQLNSWLSGLTIANLVMSVLSSFFSQNSIFLLRYVDFCQTLSYLGYVNMKYPVQMDKILKIYDHFNLGYLLPRPVGFAGSVEISTVDLQSNPYDSQLEYKGNPLFFVNGRLPFIAVNAFSYLVFYLIFVVLYLLLRLVLFYQPDMDNLQKFVMKFPHSIFLNLLIITSQEMITHTFIQFTNFTYKSDTTIGIASIIIGIGLAIVMVLCVVYLIVRTRRKLSKEMKQSVFDATSKMIREVKEQTGMPSHFQLSIFVRKLFFSLSVAFLYQSAPAQASVFIVTQIMFMVYFYLKRPFNSIKHHRVASFIEISFLFFTFLIFIASFRSGGGLVATMKAFGIFLILFQCGICMIASYYTYLIAIRLIEIKQMFDRRYAQKQLDQTNQFTQQQDNSFQINMTTNGPLDQSHMINQRGGQKQAFQTRQQQLQTLNNGTARFQGAGITQNGFALGLGMPEVNNASYLNETAPVLKKNYLSDSNNTEGQFNQFNQQASNYSPALQLDDSDSENGNSKKKSKKRHVKKFNESPENVKQQQQQELQNNSNTINHNNNGFTSNAFSSTYNSIQSTIQKPIRTKKEMKTFSQSGSIISSDEANSIMKPRRLHPLAGGKLLGSSSNQNNQDDVSGEENLEEKKKSQKKKIAASESEDGEISIESNPKPRIKEKKKRNLENSGNGNDIKKSNDMKLSSTVNKDQVVVFDAQNHHGAGAEDDDDFGQF